MRSWAGVHLLASDPRGLVTLMRILRDPSSSFSEDGGLQDVRRVLRWRRHGSTMNIPFARSSASPPLLSVPFSQWVCPTLECLVPTQMDMLLVRSRELRRRPSPLPTRTATCFRTGGCSVKPSIPLNPLAVALFAQSILETIVDIFDPLVGMGRAVSSAELEEKPRGASFVAKLFIPFSGKLSRIRVNMMTVL